MFSLAPFWIKLSKSADTVFFSTELLSSLLVSLCFDNRKVIKKNKHIPLKQQLLATETWWGDTPLNPPRLPPAPGGGPVGGGGVL